MGWLAINRCSRRGPVDLYLLVISRIKTLMGLDGRGSLLIAVLAFTTVVIILSYSALLLFIVLPIVWHGMRYRMLGLLFYFLWVMPRLRNSFRRGKIPDLFTRVSNTTYSEDLIIGDIVR